MNVTLKGFDSLSAKLKGLSSGATERMMPVCKQLAEDITNDAKRLVYQDGLQYQDGAIRDSLHGYAQQEDGEIKFGVKTDLDIAIYHEMGTGPVGTAEGYPGEEDSDDFITRRSTGWTYYTNNMPVEKIEKRTGLTIGADGSLDSIQDALLWSKSSHFVYTEGVPPKAFMHNAVLRGKEDARKALADAIREELEK